VKGMLETVITSAMERTSKASVVATGPASSSQKV
jgi:hypothetical protein